MKRKKLVTREDQREAHRQRRVGRVLFPLTWKPASLERGHLVLVLPQSADGVLYAARLLSGDRRKILARGVLSRLPGSGRLQVEFFRAGSTLPVPCVLELQLLGGKKRWRKIANPRGRSVVR